MHRIIKRIRESVTMKKRWVSCAVCQKAPGQLGYLVLEHSAVGPIEFLRRVINEHKFGILLLGCDAPNLLSITEAQRLVQWMKSEGILVSIRSGFPWISHDEVPKLHQRDWATLVGDALLLKTKTVEQDFKCTHLPEPSGFNKDKLSSKDAAFLDSILSDDDVYIHDDFRESFVVTKNSDILDAILEEIQRFERN